MNLEQLHLVYAHLRSQTAYSFVIIYNPVCSGGACVCVRVCVYIGYNNKTVSRLRSQMRVK